MQDYELLVIQTGEGVFMLINNAGVWNYSVWDGRLTPELSMMDY